MLVGVCQPTGDGYRLTTCGPRASEGHAGSKGRPRPWGKYKGRDPKDPGPSALLCQPFAYLFALPLFALQDLGQRLGNALLECLREQAHYLRLAQRLRFYGVVGPAVLIPVVPLGFGLEAVLLYLCVRDGDPTPVERGVGFEDGACVCFDVAAGEVQVAKIEHAPSSGFANERRDLRVQEAASLPVNGGDRAEVVGGDVAQHARQRARLAQNQGRWLSVPHVDSGER
jgi:hypothetical protein